MGDTINRSSAEDEFETEEGEVEEDKDIKGYEGIVL